MDFNELIKWVRSLNSDSLFEMSKDPQFTGSEKRFLYDAGKRISRSESLTTKQMQWLHSIFEKAASAGTKSTFDSDHDYLSRKLGSNDHRHLCVRLAWHDNAWNGNICLEPENNIYCVGEQSLLSDRLRRRRDLKVECKKDCKGKSANSEALGDYQPPCFWSINAFGNQNLEFAHDNPAESTYPHIKEAVPPYSVISWPFDLAFVRDTEERKKFGSYYPTQIFERRIKDFHARVVEKKSIVFLYCKFSNPVSGDDSDYLLAGCGLLSDKGAMNWFDVSPEILQATKDKKKEPNFPTLNWALRYSMNFEQTGIRIPYQEYLKLMDGQGGITREMLDDIKVVIREPELIEGFTYVAKHIDDDQSIFLLMKLRQSLLEVKRHGILSSFDVDDQLEKIEQLLSHCWISRGYFPGLKSMLLAVLSRGAADTKEIDAFISDFDLSSIDSLNSLSSAIESGDSALAGDILDALESFELSVAELMRLASLNLTATQFRRILDQEAIEATPSEVAENPYLLFEGYEPQEHLNDKLSGDKIDSFIDLFKIDIALFPHRRYQKRITNFHDWKISDKRRVRAVLISLLGELENQGHCFDTAAEIERKIERYPLFYQLDDEYRTNLNFNKLERSYLAHFEQEVVVSALDGQTVYYLKSVFDDERYVAHTIETLMSAPDNTVAVSTAPLVQQATNASHALGRKLGLRFDAGKFISEREKLFATLPFRKFSVLTGSPGAGKSFELLKLVDHLNKLNERYLILSLTGKAVLRLRNNELELKNIQAKTIDKFLYEVEKQSGIKSIVHTLIIEEASMADISKLAEVLRAVDPTGKNFKRLILVGDENQLPPIGFGKPFSDVIDSLRMDHAKAERHFVSLTTNCRAELPDDFIDFTKVFSNESKMSERVLATAVNNKVSGLSLRLWSDKESLFAAIKTEFKELTGKSDLTEGLNDILGISKSLKEKPSGIDDFQVMSPYRTGYSGVAGINLLFQDEFRNSKQFTRKVGEKSFNIGDKLIHTKNEYQDDELFVSNGSFGLATGYNQIFFSEKDSAMPFTSLRYPDGLELAYAITVHKSQGSGFKSAFIVIPNRMGLLSRELLFTALTRTKLNVTLFVEADSEMEALKLLEQIRRRSAIANIRTSLSISNTKQFAYIPKAGVEVKSRVEYIIYRKLTEAQEKHGGFTFKYENKYELPKHSFNFHPDFTLWLDDGRTFYWEHLGRVNDRNYLKMWDERRSIYEAMGDFDKIISTDELDGISDAKIERIIEDILIGNLATEDPSNRYSQRHFSLR